MLHRSCLALVLAVGASAAAVVAQDARPQGDPEGEAKAPASHATTRQIECVGTWTMQELVRFDLERVGPPDPWVVPAPKQWKRGHELGLPDPGAVPAPAPQAPPSAIATCSEMNAPTITSSFLGLEDAAITIPPDTMGAVGPNDIVVMLNGQVRLQDRSGNEIVTVALTSFWAPVLPSAPFDPVIIFDPDSDRWIACVDSHRRSASSQTLFAISTTNDPGGAWSFYSIDADSTNIAWADFPRMGYNGTWIAITNNMFTIASDSFVGASMWVIDKATALVPGGPLTITTFAYPFDNVGGIFGASMTPATTHDPAESALWIIDAVGFTTGGVQGHRISSITGTGPAPVWAPAPGGPFPGSGLFPVTTNYANNTPTAKQLGTATRIATNGARIYDADFRNGRLWYTHVGGVPVSSPTRTSSFWYEIDPSLGAASPIVQSGVVDDPISFHFFPSIAVNCANDMMMGFTRSNLVIYAEAAYTWRSASDPAGTTRPVVQIKAGEDSYVKDFGSGSVRWGDYSATVVDPVDDRSMWTLQEYARTDVGGSASDDRWGTWWGQLFAPTICIGDVNGDGSTNAADFTILAGNFGSNVPPNTGGDLNGDGIVNAADFVILAGDFGC